MNFRFSVGLVILVSLLLSACSPVAPPHPVIGGIPSSASEPDVTERIDLSETQVLSGFGFSIDLPAGWSAFTQAPVTIIAGNVADCETRTSHCITHDHRSLDFLHQLGLPEDPTLEDLFEMNRTAFRWGPLDTTELTVSGVPALSVRAHDNNGGWFIMLMGLTEEEAFLLNVSAPSVRELDAFMPTWERMLASIQPAVG